MIRRFVLAGMLVVGLTDIARATPIASISGPIDPLPSVGGLNIGAGRATQFQTTVAFESVSVTADLSTLPGIAGTATAFLTTRIGPGTTVADEIAHTTVDLPDFFGASHTVTLFTGLTLAPADYYLIIVTPQATSGIWQTSDSHVADTVLFPCTDVPCPATIGAGNPAFPNWQMFMALSAPYAPAATWTPFHFGFGEMHFAVDGTLVQQVPPTDPPPAVPEPGTLTLMLTGLVVAARKRIHGQSR